MRGQPEGRIWGARVERWQVTGLREGTGKIGLLLKAAVDELLRICVLCVARSGRTLRGQPVSRSRVYPPRLLSTTPHRAVLSRTGASHTATARLVWHTAGLHHRRRQLRRVWSRRWWTERCSRHCQAWLMNSSSPLMPGGLLMSLSCSSSS